ncbi:hypothetical protein GCM10007049_02700 [Echinicola pacifica]|uniref:PNPLA domain-containing protein n=1 Tax=Echinicola pacifica TaxID=346377 RepID=A0A918PMV0_9BACT|nr:patatin-like phospholipase family protein [Echinicola pacifica]GGZ14304.1 hypothetical protein GCM10007049_02700 [Echinicola pacifica]
MWNSISHSFPVQLLRLHLKKNLTLVALWGILVMVFLGGFGKVLGIPYLFLDPEYLNKVGWQSYFMMGVGFSIFTMAFHMTTYIMDAARFKFLAVLSKPFLKFCINNSLIPFLVYLTYCFAVIQFQLGNEDQSSSIIWSFLMGFSGGNLLTFALLFIYFAFTNKDFFIMFADNLDRQLRRAKVSRANVIRRYKDQKLAKDTVYSYLDLNLKLREVRMDLAHFEGHKILKVFDQNHLNLVVIEAILVAVILLLGFVGDTEWLQFPAAMSVLLILSILTLLVGALTFWLRSWTSFVVIAFFLLINGASRTPWLNRPHTALGMDYSVDKAEYNLQTIRDLMSDENLAKDKALHLEILENWKAQFPAEERPKLVILACSGGGQRSALWTLHVIQQMHAITKGKIMDHTRLITGASGGLIGAAFFRELYLRTQLGELDSPVSIEYLDQISSDNLNPIIFTLMVNDLLIRNQYIEYEDNYYLKDRGYAFENQLNKNTMGVLDKALSEYEIPEYEAQIPLLPITPLIVNDGRKLLIAPHSMSFMGGTAMEAEGTEKVQVIDFLRFFEKQNSSNLRFISALRMGATFPFITPNIQLPSNPQMEIMDAGLSDNFGISDALRFIDTFDDWIHENTDGVVLITIRDSEKVQEIEDKKPPSILQKLFIPIKNIYINWDNVQTLNNERAFTYMKEKLPFAMDRIEFEYSSKDFLEGQLNQLGDSEVDSEQLEIQRASLNWRLTSKEKRDILNSISSPQNQYALDQVKELFGAPPR